MTGDPSQQPRIPSHAGGFTDVSFAVASSVALLSVLQPLQRLPRSPFTFMTRSKERSGEEQNNGQSRAWIRLWPKRPLSVGLIWSSSPPTKNKPCLKKPRSRFSILSRVGDAYYICFVLYFYGAHRHGNKEHRWKSRLEIPRNEGADGEYGRQGLSLVKREEAGMFPSTQPEGSLLTEKVGLLCL